tara:strand:+ start:297 stop:533 length:237 start_codon:yes stop_codon:yes gene_type:complete
MPHLMKPQLTREDRDRNPIRMSEKKDNDKVVKPQDVFEGYKKPQKPKKKCVKVCPKGNKICHCSQKKKDKDMKKKSKY